MDWKLTRLIRRHATEPASRTNIQETGQPPPVPDEPPSKDPQAHSEHDVQHRCSGEQSGRKPHRLDRESETEEQLSGWKLRLFRVGYWCYANTAVGRWYHNRQTKNSRVLHENLPHSIPKGTSFGTLTILCVPVVYDNWAFVVYDSTDVDSCFIVDPSDCDMVMDVINKLAAKSTKENAVTPRPQAVLTTHRHWDHAGGNYRAKVLWKHIKVYGGEADHVYQCTNKVDDGDKLTIGKLRVTAHHVPGHTKGHIMYLLHGEQYEAPDSVFTGDFLFHGSIGYLFEGEKIEMVRSLDKLSRVCKENTLIWPGHEYTRLNLLFTKDVDPKNAEVKKIAQEVEELRRNDLPSCPLPFAKEQQINAFLRLTDPKVIAYAKKGQFSCNPCAPFPMQGCMPFGSTQHEMTDKDKAKILSLLQRRKFALMSRIREAHRVKTKT